MNNVLQGAPCSTVLSAVNLIELRFKFDSFQAGQMIIEEFKQT